MSLKDFQIIGKLGQGAYSSVYKVRRVLDSQIYALKKVKMYNLSNKQQQNALNQVRILASIKNPNVVGYKQAFIQDKFLCIVMQYLDDGDLYQKIVTHKKNGTLFQQNTIWTIFINIVMGLAALHQLKIFHRDLKSANVFLSKDGVAKLGDMNVSKIAKNGLLYTQTGTPYYASPEVWNEQPYDSKSDIWSLGCVFYQMVTLNPPFQAEDMDGLCKKVNKCQYHKIGNEYSKLVSKMIKEMLQLKPSNRPSAEQILNNLNSKATQLEIIISNQGTPQQLLQTIRANKKLHYLTNSLPKSNYQNGYQIQKKYVRRIGSREGKHALPKLDRVILKNPLTKVTQNHKQLQINKKNDELMKILRIEGKSKNNQGQKNIDDKNNGGIRDIRAELRKIYNIKQSSKKINNRIELPKLK